MVPRQTLAPFAPLGIVPSGTESRSRSKPSWLANSGVRPPRSTPPVEIVPLKKLSTGLRASVMRVRSAHVLVPSPPSAR